MPFVRQEAERHGENWNGTPFRGDVSMRAREMPSAANPEAAVTFDTLLGNRPPRRWTVVASQ
jgi:hypothetical protein